MQKQAPSRARVAPTRAHSRQSFARALALGLVAVALCCGCTLHHSKQALYAADEAAPVADATFVQEEDSGVSLLGLFEIAEPDHYAVLLERARRRYKCSRIHHAQLDFFTDHWLLIAFPISRVTAVCDPPHGNESKAPAKP